MSRQFCAGLTRTELLVLVVILLLLVGVGIGPLEHYFHQKSIDRALKSAMTLNTILFQYATDNDGTYPSGLGTAAPGKSEGIARNLLENNYTPDPDLFALGHAPIYNGKGGNFEDIKPENVSWDFTAGATPSTGITTSAPDDLPIVYSTGETVTYPTQPGAGLDLPISGAGPFGNEGIIVAYKSGRVDFLKSQTSSAGLVAPRFIPPDFKPAGNYSQARP